jgi:predicted lipid carrier protein YhbT
VVSVFDRAADLLLEGGGGDRVELARERYDGDVAFFARVDVHGGLLLLHRQF